MICTLLGYFSFKKKDTGEDRILLNFLGDKIPKEKGDGYFIVQQVVRPEIIPEDLKAGEVEVEKSGWSSYISAIRNTKK